MTIVQILVSAISLAISRLPYSIDCGCRYSLANDQSLLFPVTEIVVGVLARLDASALTLVDLRLVIMLRLRVLLHFFGYGQCF